MGALHPIRFTKGSAAALFAGFDDLESGRTGLPVVDDEGASLRDGLPIKQLLAGFASPQIGKGTQGETKVELATVPLAQPSQGSVQPDRPCVGASPDSTC